MSCDFPDGRTTRDCLSVHGRASRPCCPPITTPCCGNHKTLSPGERGRLRYSPHSNADPLRAVQEGDGLDRIRDRIRMQVDNWPGKRDWIDGIVARHMSARGLTLGITFRDIQSY
jgi:hypothetical protein